MVRNKTKHFGDVFHRLLDSIFALVKPAVNLTAVASMCFFPLLSLKVVCLVSLNYGLLIDYICLVTLLLKPF